MHENQSEMMIKFEWISHQRWEKIFSQHWNLDFEQHLQSIESNYARMMMTMMIMVVMMMMMNS